MKVHTLILAVPAGACESCSLPGLRVPAAIRSCMGGSSSPNFSDKRVVLHRRTSVPYLLAHRHLPRSGVTLPHTGAHEGSAP